MGVVIVRLAAGQFVKWSNTVDAPVSPVLTRDEAIHELETQDQVPFSHAVRLLDVAEDTGVSDPEIDLAELLASNRAGPAETRLSVAEILWHYRSSV